MLTSVTHSADLIKRIIGNRFSAEPLTLRQYLSRLVFLLVIPFTLFASTLVVLLALNEKAAVRSGMEATSQALLTVVNWEIESSTRNLQTLATSGYLAGGNLNHFGKSAERVMLVQQGWANVILRDTSGNHLFSLRDLPQDQVIGREKFMLLLQTGERQIHSFPDGSGGEMIDISVPVILSGKIEYVLTASLHADTFGKLLEEENLPDDWVAVIYDANRRLVARTPDVKEALGRPAAADVSQAIANNQQGWIRAKTLDNEPSYIAFSKSTDSQWSVATAVPIALIDASIYRNLSLVAGSGVFILLFGIRLALGKADRIARPIEKLSVKSAALGKGSAPLVASSPVKEIRTLEEKFQEADVELYSLTEELEQRIRERTTELQQQIEEKDKAKEDLRRQAELLDLSHDGILVRTYSDSRIQFWSSGATQLYGWTPQEALGKISHALLQTHFPQTLDDIEQQLSRHGRWEGELIHTRKNGTRIIIASRWSLRRDQHGNPLDILESDYDITAKKQAEQKLLESERLASLGLTAAVFAHEVANPLHNINFCLHVLNRDLANTGGLESQIKTVEAASEEIDRLNDLLEEFRFLARPQTLARQRANFRQIVEEVLAPMRQAQDAARVSVELQFNDDLPQIAVDRDKIKQVIVNLCKNAVEAMPEGGRLTLKSYCLNRSVILEISDTGAGIPAGMDVFHLFTTTKPYGTGLGLAVVNQIVSAHGGTIDYVSQPGIGTTFKISLPLHVDVPDSAGESSTLLISELEPTN